MVRRIAGADRDAGLVCLHGQWAGGGGIVASRPVATRDFDAYTEAIDAVRTPPNAGSVVDDDFVGGGWFGWLAYDGPSYLAFYDHLLRHDHRGRWRFEALWTSDRADALDERRRELTDLLLQPAHALPAGSARSPEPI